MGPSTKNKHNSTESEKPAAIASPNKKKGKRPTLNDASNRFITSRNPSLLCYGFGEQFSLEAYLFVKDENNDSFTNGFTKYASKKEIVVPALESAGFVRICNRRIPHCKQDKDHSFLKNTDGGFPRKVMIRLIPNKEDPISTPETRAEGLQVLKAFLMSDQNTAYPPDDILTYDCTNEADPDSLDTFFLDDEIIAIVKQDVEDHQQSTIYSDFPDFARKIWSGNNYPEKAKQFGFP
jgi:hypothetical protein